MSSIHSDRYSQNDDTYELFAYIVCNDVEILMYTLCASVTVLAPLFTHSHSADGTPLPIKKTGDSSTNEVPSIITNPLASAASSSRNRGARQPSIQGWALAMNDSEENLAGLNEQTRSHQIQTVEEFEMTTNTRPSDIESRPQTLSRYATERTFSYDRSSPHPVVQNQLV